MYSIYVTKPSDYYELSCADENNTVRRYRADSSKGY